MEPYQRFTVTADCAEDDLFELHEHGALGTEIIDEKSFTCFFPDDGATVQAAQDYCISRGWKCSSAERLEGQNWVQACAEIWTPLQVGTLRIYPLLNEKERAAVEPDTIYIVPGEGFGTGHHPSTRLAMQMVQHIQETNPAEISQVLDFGTGNGILAIAAGMAFPRASIEAIDNDPSALPNAQENIELNNLADRISLSVNSIEGVPGQRHLITANIYAEVLVAHAEEMHRSLHAGGYLILAGIMESRAYLVREKFTEPEWRPVRHLTESGWESFLFQRA